MSGSAAPRTSFVVTCHNLGVWLEETLDSLFAQTDQDFEIVLVNDGSTDSATCRLLATLSRERMTVIHSERRGLPGARNLGARHSKGSLLCMVDADDLLEPTYLARSVAALEASPGAAFASHWLRAFGDEHWEWTPTDCTFPALLHANTINGAALLRRGAFDRVGGFDESMIDGCEDWEFWIRVVDAGYHGVIIPEFLFRYRRRADSMSRTMHDVPGMPALYRSLVQRHRDLFAKHATTLLAWRDEGIAILSSGRWSLESEWVLQLESEPRWSEDNRRETAHRARLEATPQASEHVRQLEARVDVLETQVSALHDSWSWRITWPLRRLVDWSRGRR